MLRAKVYLADIMDNLCHPSAEIVECKWIDDTSRYNLGDITLKIIDSLKRDGYL